MEQLNNNQLRIVRDLLSQGYGYETAYQMMKLAEQREQAEVAQQQSSLKKRIAEAKADFANCCAKYKARDPWGNEFPSRRAMCEHYGVNLDDVNTLLRYGKDFKWILSQPDLSVAINDCEAESKSRKKELEIQKRTETLKGIDQRLISKALPSIQRAKAAYDPNDKKWLTCQKAQREKSKYIYDHLGNAFRTQKSMCFAWGIAPALYERRIHRFNWTVEQALITPPYLSAYRRRKGRVGVKKV